MSPVMIWEKVKILEALERKQCECVDAYDDDNRCLPCRAHYAVNAIGELLREEGLYNVEAENKLRG